jgi:hypothetical protein
MAKKEAMFWQGHPVKDKEHQRRMNLRAADLEFGQGLEEKDEKGKGTKVFKRLPRHKAEEHTKHEDRQERHAKTAAHHMDGFNACKAVGNHEDAQRHMDSYGLHLKALGFDAHSASVPGEVKKWMNAPDKKFTHSYEAHEDDTLLLEGDGKVKKSEDDKPKTPSSAGNGKLLDYLRSKGLEATINDVHPNMPPTRRLSPLRVAANNPGVTPAPSKANLRVVKAEFLPWLERMSTLAKAQPQPRSPREFSAHKTFLRNRRDPEERAFDYSSFLEPDQYDNGYRMFVLSHGKENPVKVHVLHHQMGAGPTWGTKAGGAVGNVQDGDLGVESYFTHHQHQGKGLEPAMLNAMMHHGKHQMGAYSLSHGEFEPDASALVEAVSKPHGLELGDVEDVDVPEPTNRMSPKEGRQRRPLMVDYGD